MKTRTMSFEKDDDDFALDASVPSHRRVDWCVVLFFFSLRSSIDGYDTGGYKVIDVTNQVCVKDHKSKKTGANYTHTHQ